MKPRLATWVPLSSFEVYEAISGSGSDGTDNQFGTSSLSFFRSSLKWYLEAFHSVHQIPQERLFSLAETLYASYDLSQQEVMQIVDLRPKKQVELHCIVSDCEERLSEQDIFQILKLVGEVPVGQEERLRPEGGL